MELLTSTLTHAGPHRRGDLDRGRSGRRTSVPRSALALSLLLVLAACGDDSTGGATNIPEVAGATLGESTDEGTSAEALASCLSGAGLEVVTAGDLPIVAGVTAVGIPTADGLIEPGGLGAALFAYGSEDEAIGGEQTMQAIFQDVTHYGSVVVAFAPSPSAELREAVEGCARG